MIDPYQILQVPANTDDEEVRQAYLAQLRLYPPEHHPERFRQIREAFELLASERNRRDFSLFQTASPDLHPLVQHLLKQKSNPEPMTAEVFSNHFGTVLKQHRLKRE
ncbi:MAG: DnaJ domain-containing protein [Magnetococcales bacterium]|nr:DnaJ domain-containing protein [Magnetococcales bacterium]